ncbi:pectinesterase-like isoform X2 [Aegilops tauschii subsp. strangulata]|uniref:pectinesterase-like isoform X2 n=1 Tax=Aegilops tauschii subsp. strangulata TaxID=200361 RepID=UPI001E1CA86F|nr:pectinesterase-like [Aegilops tauschii subsp. strangulata]
MTNKAATASIIAAVGVVAVIGTIAAVTTSKKASDDGGNMSTSIKLSQLCSSTLYPAKCENSLTPVVNESSNPEEVLRAALQVAMNEIGAAFAKYTDVGKGAADKITLSAIGECKKLLDDAIVDLKDMAGLRADQVVVQVNDLRVWISGVMTYIYTCADGFDKPELKHAMDKLLRNSTELSSNALAIITRVGQVLATEVVGTIEDLPNSHRRKLLSAGVFPEWVSSHTRRLLQIPGGLQKPNAVVAADGSGNFKTITEALNSVPKKSTARFVIYVKAGEYKEYVTVSKDQANVFMYGDGPTKTRVIGDKSNKGGFATIATRTFSAEGNGFICKSMGFVNTAGPDGHQAVALHVQGDMSVFFNCRFEGYQDTLYVHANRQFFRNCEVLGTIDFIFGNSAAVFQNCLMTVRKPMESQGNMVTAHGRTDPNMPTGIVLQGCKIVPEDALFPVRQTVPSYLGRPWKEYSRTVIMESTIGDLIKPEGWSEWMGDLGLKTLYYAEYANTGPGAGTSKRVTWPGYRVIGQAEATQFTAGVFIDGMSWLKNTGTPNVMGFIK